MFEAGLPAEASAWPIVSGHGIVSPYEPVGPPPQYIAVRPEFHRRLGGFAPRAPLGDQAVVLDYLERAVEAGFAVANRNVPGRSRRSRTRPFGGRRVAALAR